MKRFGTFDDQRGISMGATRRHLAEGARESRWAINLSSSSPFLPSSCPMKGNHLGTPVLRRKRGRESPLGPLIFGIPAFWWAEGLLCKEADGKMGCSAFLHCCGLEVCYRARHGMRPWCRCDIITSTFHLACIGQPPCKKI